MDFKIDVKKMVERFERYVKIDTQSQEESSTYPSTEKQLNLSRLLVDELKAIGAEEVELTEHGYVFATIPANLTDSSIPTIGFLAHVDTSPDVSGKDVKPYIWANYQGGDLVLKDDTSQIIKEIENPALKSCIGHDIISASGTTLLGADNKAGIAEIMSAADYLISHPEIKHGKIRIAFTVDEEVGTGTQHFDVKQFGANYAYTIDGETAGELEDETFCADSVTIKFTGINIHPGYGKDKLLNAVKLAADYIDFLPKNGLSPETTEKREGYVHPHDIKGGVEECTVKFLIRDFSVEGLHEKEDYLKEAAALLKKKHPGMEYNFKVDESYRNMKYILDKHPKVTQYAMEAIEKSGLKPIQNIIRGGTDGARLSYMGLPTPNVFTGGHNFHSKLEWVSIQDMEKSSLTILNLIKIWAEKK
ncbi:MAG: peptidase T [Calditrichia bacterium]|nr:peptidase T [Calditrichia bacterium]